MSYIIENLILSNIENEIIQIEKELQKKGEIDNSNFIMNSIKKTLFKKKQLFFKLKRKFFIKNIIYSTQINFFEAKKISTWIDQESNHMINKTAKKIHEDALENGCIVASYKKELIGFISLSKLKYSHPIYEIGSLVVHKKYQKLGIAKQLKEKLMNQHVNKLFFSITNVKTVQKINTELKLSKININIIPKKLLNIIQEEQKLLVNDIMFANENFLNFIEEKHK